MEENYRKTALEDMTEVHLNVFKQSRNNYELEKRIMDYIHQLSEVDWCLGYSYWVKYNDIRRENNLEEKS